MKKIIVTIMILGLLSGILCGCADTSNLTDSNSNNQDGKETDSLSNTTEVDFTQGDSDMFTDRDYEVGYDESNSVIIQLNGDSASASSDSVKISGSTITITENATYIISGTLDDGMIIINAKDAKLQLVLNGVNINSEACAPLYILDADKVFVTLASGTSNTLSNGGSFTAIDDNNIDGAIFSKQDVTFNGSGSLTVISPAGHGIVCKDDLVFTGGTYTINSSSHGLDANDSVRITNADISIVSGKDGIHSENSDDAELGFVYISSGTLDINAEGDGISAESYMQIEGGTFDIVSGGGSTNASKQTSDLWGGFMGGRGEPGQSMSPSSSENTDDSSTSIKGIKASGSMVINNGSFTIDSADDAIHSNTSITVNGGSFEIASGDDAFHADETLTVTSGTINITESYEGLEGLNVVISGGDITLVASDDGLNAAGGNDSSGFGGVRGDEQFGGHGGGMNRAMGGGMGGTSSSNGSIVISGGNLYIKASGDGIDSNGTLTISGGYIIVCGPTKGDTSTLDYDVSAVITGGVFIGTGASGMAQTFSDSEQGVVSVSAGSQSAGTGITLTDNDGNTIISYTPELSFDVIILSSPEITSGETYTLTVGSYSGEVTAN